MLVPLHVPHIELERYRASQSERAERVVMDHLKYSDSRGGSDFDSTSMHLRVEAPRLKLQSPQSNLMVSHVLIRTYV